MIKRNTFLTLGALFALTLPATQGAILLVTDPDASKIWQVNEAGTTSTFLNLTYNPTGITVSGPAIYVVDGAGETVHRYSTDGVLQHSFVAAAVSSIAVDLLGNVYAASILDLTVTKYDPTGLQLAQVTADAPTAVAVNGAGHVFVAETTVAGLEIRQYGSDLTPVGLWTAPSNDPFGFAFNGSDLYGAVGSDGTVEKYESGTTTTYISGLSFPAALVFAANGELFVADATSNQVLRFTAAGSPDGTFGAGFSSVSGLAFAAVPEPETYAMLGSGLLLLGLVKRKR